MSGVQEIQLGCINALGSDSPNRFLLVSSITNEVEESELQFFTLLDTDGLEQNGSSEFHCF